MSEFLVSPVLICEYTDLVPSTNLLRNNYMWFVRDFFFLFEGHRLKGKGGLRCPVLMEPPPPKKNRDSSIGDSKSIVLKTDKKTTL